MFVAAGLFITGCELPTVDNNTTNVDDNNTTAIDNNSSNIDDNSTNIDENNDTNYIALDTDGDFIPDNIEIAIGYDTNSSDQNSNGILDGLEGDKFFNKQWYIKAAGTATNPSDIPSVEGNDLNLMDVYKEYMGYNGGNPIIVQVVDSGVDIKHEDLKDNIDLSRSLNNDRQGEPTPGGFSRTHGTMVAGIVAARAFNGKGVRGVAPFAKIAASNWLVEQSYDSLHAAWYGGAGANEIAVTNNSWGRYYTPSTIYEDMMELGVKKLRDGKGRIYIFASGNSKGQNGDTNLQYFLNNQYPIVVSALDIENKSTTYSTPGANLWISAYGGTPRFKDGPTIATTYNSGESRATWEEDESKNYTYLMSGTSAASPMVTGSVALILEACPNLGWRDVKYILAKSAKKVDSSSSSWVTNSAGFNFSRDYGFGLIDTKKAINICKNNYSNLGVQGKIVNKKRFYSKIDRSKVIPITIDKSKKIEWIEVTIDIDTQNASDFNIYLTSPSGTKTKLVGSGTKIGEQFIPYPNWMLGGFRFGAAAFLDEDSIGDWHIEIVDTKRNNSTLHSAELVIYGY